VVDIGGIENAVEQIVKPDLDVPVKP